MHVYKAALRAFFRHPAYLAIYVGLVSLMGLFLGNAVGAAEGGNAELASTSIALVNRDADAAAQGGEETSGQGDGKPHTQDGGVSDSHDGATTAGKGAGALSAGLEEYLASAGTVTRIEDSQRAMQDALMSEDAMTVVIVPEGFTEDFLAAVRAGADAAPASGVREAAPRIETAASFVSGAEQVVESRIDEYLGMARLFALSEPDAGPERIAELAARAVADSMPVAFIDGDGAANPGAALRAYLEFAPYPLTLAIGVLSAIIVAAFRRRDIRSRNTASPWRPMSIHAALAGACLTVATLTWTVVLAVGAAVFRAGLAAVGWPAFLASAAALYAFCLVPLALGFAVGLFASSEALVNGIVNIFGLVSSFLSGAWAPLETAGEPIVTISHFVPAYYCMEALDAAQSRGGPDWGALGANIGVICLFAAAILAVGLAAARTGMPGVPRSRSAAANAVADTGSGAVSRAGPAGHSATHSRTVSEATRTDAAC